jgi:hypothetical protein
MLESSRRVHCEGMNEDVLLTAWPVSNGPFDLRLLAAAAREGKLGHPQLQLRAVANLDDSITAQVVEGSVPVEPRQVLYILGRGLFRLTRRERWPGGRELLLLRAWASL